MYRKLNHVLCIIVVSVAIAGCGMGTRLPVPPNVLRDGSGSTQLEALLPAARTPEMRIFYVTDRMSEGTDNRGEIYGYRRARAVTYGEATVSLGESAKWDELVQYSGSRTNAAKYPMKVTSIKKVGRFSPTLERLQAVDGRLVMDAEAERQEEAQAQAVINGALTQSNGKDVYIFVHGFGNTLDDAILRTASMWHYTGRPGVAVTYSWPAGIGGLLGYFYDRESGEFTVYHLKRTLRIIAGAEGVERIHLVAHSRGTDVAVTALRELNGEYRGAGKDPSKELKLATLVLAAPDLDIDVFAQRFGSENMISVAEQIVIYGSAEDIAMKLSRWLFSDTGRVGSFDPTRAQPGMREKLEKLPSLQFIRSEVSGFSSSHAYVFGNPAAMSDLILVLRDRRRAGKENGRPLGDEVGWWRLDDSYFKDVADGK